MHEVLHVAILATTLAAAAGGVMLLLWPLAFGSPLPTPTRWALLALVGAGIVLLALEWFVVH